MEIPVIKYPKIYKNSYKVKMLNKKLEQIQIFNCISDAARYLIEHNYTTNLSLSSIISKIKLVCDGKRKTAYKFYWSYTE